MIANCKRVDCPICNPKPKARPKDADVETAVPPTGEVETR